MGCQFQPGNDWEQLLGWGSPRCIEMHLFIGMSLIWPSFIVTILHIGVQPCPTFIRLNRCALVRPKIIQQYRETKRKSTLQALAKPKNALVKRPGRSPLTPKTSARPQLPLLQSRLFMDWSVSGWIGVVLPSKSSAVEGLRRLGRLGMAPWREEREERWATALSLDSFGLMKKMSSTILYHVNAHIIQSLKNKTQSSMSWHFNIIWIYLDVCHLRSNLPFAHELQPQNASVLWKHVFSLKRFDSLKHLRLKLATRHLAASLLCKHLLLNFEMSWDVHVNMFWHFHTWRDLRWFADYLRRFA